MQLQLHRLKQQHNKQAQRCLVESNSLQEDE